jgi:hypothetical protein
MLLLLALASLAADLTAETAARLKPHRSSRMAGCISSHRSIRSSHSIQQPAANSVRYDPHLPHNFLPKAVSSR